MASALLRRRGMGPVAGPQVPQRSSRRQKATARKPLARFDGVRPLDPQSYNRPPMTALDALLSRFPKAELDELVETRRDLHRHPELGFAEKRTAGVVASRLRAAGLSPREGVGKTGVTADAGGGGPRILV